MLNDIAGNVTRIRTELSRIRHNAHTIATDSVDQMTREQIKTLMREILTAANRIERGTDS